MQIIPDKKNSRLTAILLLVVVLILAYLLFFHWFFIRHQEYASELAELKEQLARFEAIAVTREISEQKLQSIRESREDASLFLSEADFNEAAAAMSERLGQMVATQAESDCQIVSRQPVRSRVQERYERVTVNVRMRCETEDLMQILYRLESEIPMIIVDELNIIRPQARRRVAGQIIEVGSSLDIRFNMSGFRK